jgi:hypothetical protein
MGGEKLKIREFVYFIMPQADKNPICATLSMSNFAKRGPSGKVRVHAKQHQTLPWQRPEK